MNKVECLRTEDDANLVPGWRMCLACNGAGVGDTSQCDCDNGIVACPCADCTQARQVAESKDE